MDMPQFDFGKLLTRTVAPSASPITLAEAKMACRVDHSDDDTFIQTLIDAATAHLDYDGGVTGRAFMPQTWTYSVAEPDRSSLNDYIKIPITPVTNITGITYYDADNVSQVFATSNVRLITNRFDAWIKLTETADWPTYYEREDAFTITFTAGYSTVPEPLKQAVKFLVAHWYDNRSPVEMGISANMVPYTFDAMIAPYRKSLML